MQQQQQQFNACHIKRPPRCTSWAGQDANMAGPGFRDGFANQHLPENVMRLGLGRRTVNLLHLAQRTKIFTNGVDGRTWIVGREFESHVHHEIDF